MQTPKVTSKDKDAVKTQEQIKKRNSAKRQKPSNVSILTFTTM